VLASLPGGLRKRCGAGVSAVGPVEALGGLSAARGSGRQHCLRINSLWNLLGSSESQWAHRGSVNPLGALWALGVPRVSEPPSLGTLAPWHGAKSRVRNPSPGYAGVPCTPYGQQWVIAPTVLYHSGHQGYISTNTIYNLHQF